MTIMDYFLADFAHISGLALGFVMGAAFVLVANTWNDQEQLREDEAEASRIRGGV